MAKKDFDTRIDDLKRKEEELRAERQRVETEKRGHERKQKAKTRDELGRVAESYGFPNGDSLEQLLRNLTSTNEGIEQLTSAGAVRTNRWKGHPEIRSEDVHNEPKGEIEQEEARVAV